ncbi:RagB/SusD family nutrient uptake outer membrane protein [Fibrella sp. WM1]|uniref:RagB/SusD family nutrient uptake outer membrane protein n=1 Tax=Fibrella musci TaxID=3242485 RepID=UPI00351FA6D4
MKKKLMLASLAVVLSLSACTDKLELQPQQSIDAATALSDAQAVESAIIGSYGILGGGALYGTNFNLLSELQGSEGYVSWRGTFASYREVANKTYTNANAEAQRTWIAAYGAINNVNGVLNALNVVTDADQKSTFEGEARFIRGILFFELVRYYALPWGATSGNTQLGIPLVLTPSSDVNQASTQTPRSTVAQTYTQVIDDLTKAASLLPDDNGTRADRYTALAFLARVYLQQGNYAAALAAANSVITSGNYRLNPSVTSIFRNRNTQESIFEIQQNDQNNAGTSNDGLTTFYASIPTPSGARIGRSDVRIISTFVNSYAATDARRTELLYVGALGGASQYYTGKFTDFGANIPVIRLAEMYLIRAEANLQLGSTTGASPLADVNLIRVRAGLAPLTGTLTLAQIVQERRWELAFEGLRIHDIKRLRLSTGTFAWNAPKLVFPIPKREIDVNPAIVQNEGY